ncbi:MAG: AEC family transporter [Pseudomonadales bacterium]|nr:AEC family transporter [Pseudomonadales bacterium]
MATYLSILLETLDVTGPIFIIVLTGLALRRLGFIDDHFIEVSSRLVFSLCLPILLFTTITRIDLSATLDPGLVVFSLVASLFTFSLAWLAAIMTAPTIDRGVLTQAAFRSNLGVIGLALCASAYGNDGLALASILMAVLTVSYNILSVIVLSIYAETAPGVRKILIDIVRNPLIIAIAIALLFAVGNIPVPGVLRSTGEYLGRLALPLALLGAGAAMNLRTIRDSGAQTIIGTLLKTILLPGAVTAGAVAMGYSGTALGVVFLLFVSPTATASYIMVKSMGGNDRLAANLVMVTTLVGIFTTSLGLFLLRLFGLA